MISGSLSQRHGASSGCDGGTGSNTEGSCEYIEEVGDSRHGVVLQLGGWARY